MAIINIIQKNNLEGANRLDAEYYQPYYFEILSSFHRISNCNLGQIANIAKRNFLKDVEIFEYIEIANVDLSLGLYDSQLIRSEDTPVRAKYVVKDGDVIISTVRPHRNAVAFIESSVNTQVCSSGFCVLNAKSVSKEFLFTFLKTKFVKDLLDRATTATMYPAVSETDILRLPAFIPDKTLDNLVRNNFKERRKLLGESKELYSKAKKLLFNELEYGTLVLEKKLIYSANLSSVIATNRMDAEYHQKRNMHIIEHLKRMNGVPLKKLVISKITSGSTPASENAYSDANSGIRFIRANSMSGLQVSKNDMVFITPETHEGLLARSKVKPFDVLFSIAGTIGRCAVITEGFGEANINQALAILRFDRKEINPYYAALFFTEGIGHEYVNFISRPLAQANINLTELETVLLPKIDIAKQNEIGDLIVKSHLKLEDAKTALSNGTRKSEEFIQAL